MDNNPRVSIIVPTFNRADFLKAAVASALAQNYGNVEVLVSDNASTDGTQAAVAGFLKDPRFKYYRNETNLGMVRNWRKALVELAAGSWFLILSDDDWLLDNAYISKAVSLIREEKDLAMVYANGFIDNGSERVPLTLPFGRVEDGKKIFLTRNLLGQQDFTLCNVLFNRELAIKAGAFLNNNDLASDSELFLKLCLSGKVGFIQDQVSVYRVHAGNLLATVAKDPELLANHIEWCVNPYVDAKQSGVFSERELSEWRKRVILNEAAGIYRRIIKFHKKEALRLVRDLLARSDISFMEFIYMNLVLIRAGLFSRRAWRFTPHA